MPGSSLISRSRPNSSATLARLMPVLLRLASTLAPGINAPFISVTLPRILTLSRSWALIEEPNSSVNVSRTVHDENRPVVQRRHEFIGHLAHQEMIWRWDELTN